MSKLFHVQITQSEIAVTRTLFGIETTFFEYRYKVVVNDIYVDTFCDFIRLKDWTLNFKHTIPRDSQIVISQVFHPFMHHSELPF